jgi:diguanylate cyclase (GGDEF)-like protein
VLVPVTLAGLGVLGVAAWKFGDTGSFARLGGLAALLAAALFAEAFPVPLEALPGGHVSISAVFTVSAAVLYGWAPAVIVAFLTRTTLEIVQRRPLTKFLFNGAVYSLSGAAAGGAAATFSSEHGVYVLFLQVPLASAGYYVINIPLVSAIVARAADEPFVPLVRRWVYWTAVPSAIMASVTLMLAALWQRTPALALALVGPLVAIALYQRSMHSALKAMRLALTDPLTGLGNHRHFHERLESELDRAEREHAPVTLCLIDVDDFKQINDRYGHPVGDEVLTQVAGCLRHGGEAFRLGGDEFAILLPGREQVEGVAIADILVTRLEKVECAPGQPISVSAGIATFPRHGVGRSDLVRIADTALYRAKQEGKNQVRAYRPEPVAAVV